MIIKKLSKQKEKIEIFDSDIKKFYEKNKSYCTMPFKEIFSDNAGRYKLCCHAQKMDWKYTANNTTPFKFFFSPEMEEIRNKMLSGEKLDACKVCYKLEENKGESYRTDKYRKKYGIDFEPTGIGLKLRILGSYCNLGCYMCHPYNSSTRRKEMKDVYGKDGHKETNQSKFLPIKFKEWHDSINDILENIEIISYMNITGGEPLLLPKHWELLDKIPDDHAKHITLSYDTNLSELRYKDKSIFDYVDKFQDLKLGVSADHYQDKEAWIRYPIDIKKFEANLVEAKGLIKQINVSVSPLNVFDLNEINDYYRSNFDISTTFMNIVRGPEFLSIKNLNQKDKDMLMEKYKKLPDYEYIKSELLLPKTHELDKMKNYCDRLSKNRNFNWRELWNEF
jgi:MoaA/NifB/PqqE/SkfB family radical SAM enzyme